VVLQLFVISDFGFYATHRLMHLPKLYRFHKVHHEYKNNDILAAQHFHPIDFFISIASPVLLTTVFVRPHAFTQFMAGLWIFTANLDDHIGYAFPWSPVRWFPLSAGTDAHEFHHQVNMGCYGSKFQIWDAIFQTDKVYKDWRIKQWEKEE
jgi:sterol desaturase/sphingolipid hydroxylase (fatty acid hydroxylase superfamily)